MCTPTSWKETHNHQQDGTRDDDFKGTAHQLAQAMHPQNLEDQSDKHQAYI